MVLKRALGRTGIQVSEISFGTVSLGVPYGIGIRSKADMVPENDAVKLLQSALDRGVNFFDTARGYGESEKRLGKACKNRRHHAVIATKCAHLYNEKGQLPPAGALKQVMDTSLNESLSALQTDYIDVYMMHDSDLGINSNETIVHTMSAYKEKGVVRAIGISTYTVEETRKAIESGVWDMIQVAYNLMDQSQEPLFSLARQHGVGIVVRSALLKGILTDRGSNLHPQLKPVEKHRERYKELLTRHIPTLSDLAVKFILSHEDVSSVLVGIDKPEYLQSALKVANGKYLSEEMLIRAKQLAFPDPEFLDLPRWNSKGWLT